MPVTGGFEPGDSVILNTVNDPPSDILIMPMRVVSTTTVKVRFCNVGNTAQTISSLQIRMISLR